MRILGIAALVLAMGFGMGVAVVKPPACCGDKCKAGCCTVNDKGDVTCSAGGACCVKPKAQACCGDKCKGDCCKTDAAGKTTCGSGGDCCKK